jgi:hypothetical protein
MTFFEKLAPAAEHLIFLAALLPTFGLLAAAAVSLARLAAAW